MGFENSLSFRISLLDFWDDLRLLSESFAAEKNEFSIITMRTITTQAMKMNIIIFTIREEEQSRRGRGENGLGTMIIAQSICEMVHFVKTENHCGCGYHL